MNCEKSLVNLKLLQARRMSRLYGDLSLNLSRLFLGKSKSWYKQKGAKKLIDKQFENFQNKLYSQIQREIDNAWHLSNLCKDAMVNDYLKDLQVSKIDKEIMYGRNLGALKAFKIRSTNGLDLSSRVWKIGGQTKEQIDTLITSGLLNGRSAVENSKIIRKYLKEPERQFRKLRDPKTGKLVLSNPAKNYHPGRGVYRSSYKNALRLARNEVNIAYRMADMQRNRNLPFVIGYTVHLSNAHPAYDICDELVGDYPKNFTFTGWHPNCLCFTTTKQLSKSEFKQYLKTGKIDPKKYINTVPQGLSSWVGNNSNKIKGLKSKPYFISDNFKNTKDGFALKKGVGILPPLLPPIKNLRNDLLSDYENVFNNTVPWRVGMMKFFKKKVVNKTDIKLDINQKAVVFGYTNVAESLYSPLNKLLLKKKIFQRGENYDSFLKSYSNLLDDSLENLPNYKGVVYRGVGNLTKSDMQRYYDAFKYKRPITEPHFISTSKNMEQSFRGDVKFIITSKKGKLIEHLSDAPHEEEVLFKKSSKFNVSKIEDKSGSKKIYLDEI